MRTLTITFNVTEDKAGSVLANLADTVQGLEFKVDQQVEVVIPDGRSTGKRRNDRQELVTAELAKLNQPFNSDDVKKVVLGMGLQPNSAYTMLTRMRAKKLVRKMANGTYRLTKG